MTALVAYLLAASITGSAVGIGPGHLERGSALGYGDAGPAVGMLNQRLRDAGFNADAGDVFDTKTEFAVYAFQKYHDLPTTGRFTPFMWDLLDVPVEVPNQPDADRVEVDLARQVLFVVEKQEVVLVLPISSGSGHVYRGSNGRRQVATTPEGVFQFERRIRGRHRAPLGTLYDPYYFVGGIAVHGSPQVPNHPASHGCVRVTIWDMKLLTRYIAVGEAIYVYGDEISADSLFPAPPGSVATPLI